MFCAPACRGGAGVRQRPVREGTIAPRSLCRQRERHGDCAVRAIAGARAASSLRGRNRRMVSLNRAEARCSRLPPARVTIS